MRGFSKRWLLPTSSFHASVMWAAQTQEVRLYHGDQTGNGSKNSRTQSRMPIHILTQIPRVSRFAPTNTHTQTELGILNKCSNFTLGLREDLSSTIDGLSHRHEEVLVS